MQFSFNDMRINVLYILDHKTSRILVYIRSSVNNLCSSGPLSRIHAAELAYKLYDFHAVYRDRFLAYLCILLK